MIGVHLFYQEGDGVKDGAKGMRGLVSRRICFTKEYRGILISLTICACILLEKFVYPLECVLFEILWNDI